MIGLSKKVLLANVLYGLITAFQESKDLSVLYYWLYAVSFTLQLYFDFSGYSDMAIGLGEFLASASRRILTTRISPLPSQSSRDGGT